MILLPKISVIIPVYKVEKYIADCIESILVQTFGNFELILVDDGSPDASGMICDEYADKDIRIRVVHKMNGGVTSARKLGLELARGEWVFFVDSDDTLPVHALSLLLDAAIANHADVVCGGFELINSPAEKEIRYCSGALSFSLAIEKNYGSLCANIFRKAVIDKITFPAPAIKRGEDTLMLMEIMAFSNKVYYLNDIVYNYFIRNDSATAGYTTAYYSTYENLKAFFNHLQVYILRNKNIKFTSRVKVFLRFGINIDKCNQRDGFAFFVFKAKVYLMNMDMLCYGIYAKIRRVFIVDELASGPGNVLKIF